MIKFDEEFRKIFGDKYEGCTQAGDELLEYRLKPGEVATAEELNQVAALPQGFKVEMEDRLSQAEEKQEQVQGTLQQIKTRLGI